VNLDATITPRNPVVRSVGFGLFSLNETISVSISVKTSATFSPSPGNVADAIASTLAIQMAIAYARSILIV
jgi:hypothetical protein